MSDLPSLLGTGYEFVHDGVKYRVSLITLKITSQFSNWLKVETLKEIVDTTAIDEDLGKELRSDFRKLVIAREYQWGGKAVNEAWKTTEGALKLLSLIVQKNVDDEWHDLSTSETANLDGCEVLKDILDLVLEESIGPKASWKTEIQTTD